MFDSICLAMDKQTDGIVAIEHKMLKRLLNCNKKRENASIPVAVDCEYGWISLSTNAVKIGDTLNGIQCTRKM